MVFKKVYWKKIPKIKIWTNLLLKDGEYMLSESLCIPVIVAEI